MFLLKIAVRKPRFWNFIQLEKIFHHFQGTRNIQEIDKLQKKEGVLNVIRHLGEF